MHDLTVNVIAGTKTRPCGNLRLTLQSVTLCHGMREKCGRHTGMWHGTVLQLRIPSQEPLKSQRHGGRHFPLCYILLDNTQFYLICNCHVVLSPFNSYENPILQDFIHLTMKIIVTDHLTTKNEPD